KSAGIFLGDGVGFVPRGLILRVQIAHRSRGSVVTDFPDHRASTATPRMLLVCAFFLTSGWLFAQAAQPQAQPVTATKQTPADKNASELSSHVEAPTFKVKVNLVLVPV